MKLTNLLLFFLGCACWVACESATHIDVDAAIMEKVDERLTEFKQVRSARCMERVYEEAGRIADSIILLEARQSKDTLTRPPRPIRPEQPELKTLEDSLELAPLFPGQQIKKPIRNR